MSLDVWLEGPEEEVDCRCECGHCHKKIVAWTLYAANITHNLNKMAEAAGIYQHLWRPEELAITKAWQLIVPLTKGVRLLESDAKRFAAFNAQNGWGLYEHFVPWVRNYLEACKEYPNATVRVSR